MPAPTVVARVVVVCAGVLAAAVLLGGCGGDDAQAGDASAAGKVRLVASEVPVRRWTVDDSGLTSTTIELRLGGDKVRGARLEVGGYLLPARTDARGRVRANVDTTRPARVPVRVKLDDSVRVGGSKASADERAALRAFRGSVEVAYSMAGLEVERGRDGSLLVSGRLQTAEGDAPPPVVLYSFRLRGRVTDGDGDPVKGAIVSTRSADRDFWTLSEPSDRDGDYSSFFYPATKGGPYTVRVARGDDVFEAPSQDSTDFTPLKSVSMDVRVRAAKDHEGAISTIAVEQEPGAIYEGVLVGATVDGKPVKPLAATWPAADGSFTLELPKGDKVVLWQQRGYHFSAAAATPGGPVDLASWPGSVPADAARTTAGGARVHD